MPGTEREMTELVSELWPMLTPTERTKLLGTHTVEGLLALLLTFRRKVNL